MIDYHYVRTYGDIVDDYESNFTSSSGMTFIRHQVIKYDREIYIATLINGKVFNFSIYED